MNVTLPSMARHGTDLGGLPNFGSTPAEEFDNGSMLEALKADHVIVMPQQVGKHGQLESAPREVKQ